MRARDSISGRQGSLTPACGAAWPRRLYYDVYGLIRDILEMSRVHARRVTRRREMRRERLPRGERRVRRKRWRCTEGAKIDVLSHAESESPLLRASPLPPFHLLYPPFTSFTSSFLYVFLPFPLLAATTTPGLSFAVLSTGSVLFAHSFPLFWDDTTDQVAMIIRKVHIYRIYINAMCVMI